MESYRLLKQIVRTLGLGFKGLIYAMTTLEPSPFIEDGLKVTQPILKYVLMVAIQNNSIWLINTQYRCDYTRSHAGHVML
jgi:hypothetical protein